jgi:anti-sigma factor RsiW
VTHLGDRAAAFVDGQLTPESAERATAHLAACRPCRDLVELERLTKARLSALSGPEPTPDLVGRLLAMGGPAGPLPPRPGHVPGNPRAQPVPLPEPQRVGVQVLRRATRTGRPGGHGLHGERTPGEGRELLHRGPARSTSRRETPSPRPAGRPRTVGARPSRLAVAVLGALSVVGVGVAGVAAGSSASARSPLPPRVGTTVEPASASFVPARITPVQWTQSGISARVPVDRGIARR